MFGLVYRGPNAKGQMGCVGQAEKHEIANTRHRSAYKNVCNYTILTGSCSLEASADEWARCESSKPEDSVPWVYGIIFTDPGEVFVGAYGKSIMWAWTCEP